MSKEEREKRRQLLRVAIPAGVCVVVILALALGTRVWQLRGAQGQMPAMELRGQWLGMRLAPTGSQIAADLGVPSEVKGVTVAGVQGNSRAALAGLASGDVLTRVNGKDVANLVDMYALSSRLDGTRPLQVEFLRVGRPMITNVMPPDLVTPPGATWAANRQVP
jgi:S1-C subfamily serine protease